MTTFAAVIPSAGLSSRMGRFKPLLPLGAGTVLSRCVQAFRANGVRKIIVVTGRNGEAVAKAAISAGATPVHNADYEEGMYTSVLSGVSALEGDVDAFFMLPVDIPLVRPQTVAQLMEEYRRSRPTVLYPRFLGQRGHPPLIGREVIPAILAHDGSGGLRSVLERYDDSAGDLEVADWGTVHDLDHPQDYELALARVDKAHPNAEECKQLWAMQGVSDHIAEHCRAVSRVAVALCDRLNVKGQQPGLDPELVRGAALTHDIGKGTKRHEAAGAELLERHGFFAAAAIVREHFDLAISSDAPITEKEIVFLADKLVRCHTPVSLKWRYLEKVEMYAHEEGAREAILGRLARAEAVLERVDREMDGSAEQVAREALS